MGCSNDFKSNGQLQICCLTPVFFPTAERGDGSMTREGKQHATVAERTSVDFLLPLLTPNSPTQIREGDREGAMLSEFSGLCCWLVFPVAFSVSLSGNRSNPLSPEVEENVFSWLSSDEKSLFQSVRVIILTSCLEKLFYFMLKNKLSPLLMRSIQLMLLRKREKAWEVSV